MIYQYLVVKSSAVDIFAHIKFCRDFSPEFVRVMKQGFCLATLECAVEQLINNYQEEISKEVEQK